MLASILIFKVKNELNLRKTLLFLWLIVYNNVHTLVYYGFNS
jgi:hypothetical protein